MWIEELQRELTGRQLDIWRGHDDNGQPIDLPEHKRQEYIKRWRTQRGLLRPGQPVQQPRKSCNCRNSAEAHPDKA